MKVDKKEQIIKNLKKIKMRKTNSRLTRKILHRSRWIVKAWTPYMAKKDMIMRIITRAILEWAYQHRKVRWMIKTREMFNSSIKTRGTTILMLWKISLTRSRWSSRAAKFIRSFQIKIKIQTRYMLIDTKVGLVYGISWSTLLFILRMFYQLCFLFSLSTHKNTIK